MPDILYDLEPSLTADEFIDLLGRSTLAERRPVSNRAQIEAMLAGANLIVTAREGSACKLVGISRGITDHAYCAYLSDLAVDQQFQRQGIGKELIRRTHLAAGLHTTLVLLSAPKARSYYPHIGMKSHDSCWTIPAASFPLEQESSGSSSFFPRAETGDGANPDRVADFFDALSEEYSAAIQRCVPRYDEMIWALFRYLPNGVAASPSRILELGCGTGNLTARIIERFPSAELTALDLSRNSLEKCRQRFKEHPQVHFQCGDMSTVEFDSEHFDLVLSAISIHHLPSPSKQSLFERSFQWLKPGGVLSFADQFSGASPEIYRCHMHEWREHALRAGTSDEEWEMWMQHQRQDDYHDTLEEQLAWLGAAGFGDVDCVWRHLLWTVVTSRKPTNTNR